MITISVLGLDQYVVEHYSKENTKTLAEVFETSEDNISFYAPNCYIFHKGYEQTSWNTIVRVYAPANFSKSQETAAKFLLESFKDFSINVRVEFIYIDEENIYDFVNKDYPHFISENNIVNTECDCDDECDCEGGECHCHHHDKDDELYEGNIFEGYEDKLDDIYKDK